MIQRYDLVIVGGSFAGLSCARTAALKGLKVAVIDSNAEPGGRIRTTGIVVKEASDDFDLPARLMRKVRGVRLYSPNDRSVDLSAPGYFFQATDTAGVLRWMAGEAERAGATLLFGRKFETAVEHARGVALTSLGLHAGFLIGADGARSRVAETFGLSRNTRFLAGLEIECEPLEDLDPRFLHCFADSRIAPGYFFQATDTAGVLRWMAGEAERAGATLLYGRKFETAIEHPRGVALPGLGLHAGFLIGADGPRSRVAETFGLSRNTRFLAGLEIECEPLADLDGRFLHCFADSKIAPRRRSGSNPRPAPPRRYSPARCGCRRSSAGSADRVRPRARTRSQGRQENSCCG